MSSSKSSTPLPRPDESTSPPRSRLSQSIDDLNVALDDDGDYKPKTVRFNVPVDANIRRNSDTSDRLSTDSNVQSGTDEDIDEIPLRASGQVYVDEDGVATMDPDLADSVEMLEDITPGSVDTAPTGGVKVYKRRWYILFIFSAAACLQNILWLTYNTMGEHVNEFFEISDAVVNFLALLGPLIYCIAVFPCALYIDNYGLRKSMVVCASLFLICGIPRSLAIHPDQLWAVLTCQAANALVAPILNSAPALLANVWFPAHERTVATACAFLAQFLGSAVAFLISFSVHDSVSIIFRLYMEGFLCILVAVPIFLYFPDGPPRPPTVSSSAVSQVPMTPMWAHSKKQSVKRQVEDLQSAIIVVTPRGSFKTQFIRYMHSLFKLAKNKHFIMVSISGGFSAGVFVGWSGVLTQILLPLGYEQDSVAWIGFATAIASMLGGLVVGKVADMTHQQHKKLCLYSFGLTLITFLIFMMGLYGFIIPQQLWIFVITTSLACFGLNATTPLMFVLDSEVSFPAPEAAAGAGLTFVLNFFAMLFMISQDFMPAMAMNWVFAVAIALCAVLLYFTPISYKRSAVDNPAENTEHEMEALEV